MLLVATFMAGCGHEKKNEIPDTKISEERLVTRIKTREGPGIRSLKTEITASDGSRKIENGRIEDHVSSAGLTGYLFHYPEDHPVDGALVTVRPYGTDTTSPLVQSTHTDADGSFRFFALTAGRKILATSNPKGQSFWLAPDESVAAMSPTLTDAETTHTVVKVFSGHQIQGVVYDRETSEPLSGAIVKAFIDDVLMTSATSNADGFYRLERIPHRGEVKLNAELSNFITAKLDHFTRTNQPLVAVKPGKAVSVEQNIAMLRSVTLSGRVVTQDGRGKENATLQWMNSDDLSHVTTRTRSDGYFHLPVAPFQSGNLTAKAEGYSFHNQLPVMKIANDPVDDLLLVLEPSARLKFRAINLKGMPISGATIYEKRNFRIRDSSFIRWDYKLGMTDDGGFFTANDLSSGSQMLKISAPDYVTTTPVVNLTSNRETLVEFRMESSLTVEGRVVTSEGKPQQARISRVRSNDHWQQTDSNGSFKFVGVSPGYVELGFQAKDSYTHVTTRTMAGTKDLVVVLDSRKYVTRTGRVIDHLTKQPIEKFQVANISKVSTEGKPKGEFECELANDYVYAPRISAEGYVTREFTYLKWDDKPGETLIFEMGIGATIRGRAMAGPVEPLRDKTVSVEWKGYGGRPYTESSVTDKDGYFTVSNLAYGDVTVKVYRSGSEAPLMKAAVAKDGETVDVGEISPENSDPD